MPFILTGAVVCLIILGGWSFPYSLDSQVEVRVLMQAEVLRFHLRKLEGEGRGAGSRILGLEQRNV